MSKASHIKWLDGMAVLTSGLCLLHCLTLPFIIAVLPVVITIVGASETIHLWLLVIAVPTSLYALIAGARRSNRTTLFVCGMAALTMLFLGWFFEETLPYGTLLTIVGSFLLAASHIANWRLSKGQLPHSATNTVATISNEPHSNVLGDKPL